MSEIDLRKFHIDATQVRAMVTEAIAKAESTGYTPQEIIEYALTYAEAATKRNAQCDERADNGREGLEPIGKIIAEAARA